MEKHGVSSSETFLYLAEMTLSLKYRPMFSEGMFLGAIKTICWTGFGKLRMSLSKKQSIVGFTETPEAFVALVCLHLLG